MKLYSHYLFRKIISYFLIIAIILICLIWFNKALSFIKYITDKGIGLAEFFNLFVLVLPWLVLLIIPISLFIAILITYDRMISTNEITILKNSGLDKFHLAAPVMWTALVACLVCYSMSFYFMPMANKKLRLARANFQSNYANIMISPGIFETLNDLTIYIKERNSRNELFEVLIYDNRNKEYAIIITAKSGNLGGDGDAILLYLNSGTAQKFNYNTRKSEILKFDSYVVNLSDNNAQPEGGFKWKAQERYIGELINPGEDATASELAKYRAELHHRIIYPTFSLILSLIAISFVLRGQFSRKGNIYNNLIAIITGTTFIVSIMVIYGMVEKSINLVPLLYLDLIIFTIFTINMLRSKNVNSG